jgi:hypothetical protein
MKISLVKIRELVEQGGDEVKMEYINLMIFLKSVHGLEVEEI